MLLTILNIPDRLHRSESEWGPYSIVIFPCVDTLCITSSSFSFIIEPSVLVDRGRDGGYTTLRSVAPMLKNEFLNSVAFPYMTSVTVRRRDPVWLLFVVNSLVTLVSLVPASESVLIWLVALSTSSSTSIEHRMVGSITISSTVGDGLSGSELRKIKTYSIQTEE